MFILGSVDFASRGCYLGLVMIAVEVIFMSYPSAKGISGSEGRDRHCSHLSLATVHFSSYLHDETIDREADFTHGYN
jgi:hypothetical protein